MAKWLNSNTLDNGLAVLDTAVNECRLISSYTPGDSYATVSTNTVCLISVAAGDIVLGDGAASSRQAQVGALSGTATANSGASPDLHVALCTSGSSRVDAVTDETTDQEVTSGNTVNLTAFNITMNQPT